MRRIIIKNEFTNGVIHNIIEDVIIILTMVLLNQEVRAQALPINLVFSGEDIVEEADKEEDKKGQEESLARITGFRPNSRYPR